MLFNHQWCVSITPWYWEVLQHLLHGSNTSHETGNSKRTCIRKDLDPSLWLDAGKTPVKPLKPGCYPPRTNQALQVRKRGFLRTVEQTTQICIAVYPKKQWGNLYSRATMFITLANTWQKMNGMGFKMVEQCLHTQHMIEYIGRSKDCRQHGERQFWYGKKWTKRPHHH